MQPSQQFCFTHTTGEAVYLFTLHNKKGTVVTISNYGATILSFIITNAAGESNDIVLGFDKVDDYLLPGYHKEYPYFGCAIGRYANRIKNAAFSIDGKAYAVSANHGSDMLHGGYNGFDKKVWEVITTGESFLELQYLSADGEEGFTGNLKTTIRFELTDDNELSYEYRASTDKASAVNLTHHSYFNLNNGHGDIKNHELKIYSSTILQQDEGLAANGELKEVTGTAHDFTNFKVISDGLIEVPEFDQSFVPKKDFTDTALQLVAEVRLNETKTLLQVLSTEPVVHFYTGKWIPQLNGKYGKKYGSFSGLCLETHKHPNAVNVPSFPETILREGEVYSTKTVYKVLFLEK